MNEYFHCIPDFFKFTFSFMQHVMTEPLSMITHSLAISQNCVENIFKNAFISNIRLSVIRLGTKSGQGMKTEKVSWDVGRG